MKRKKLSKRNLKYKTKKYRSDLKRKSICLVTQAKPLIFLLISLFLSITSYIIFWKLYWSESIASKVSTISSWIIISGLIVLYLIRNTKRGNPLIILGILTLCFLPLIPHALIISTIIYPSIIITYIVSIGIIHCFMNMEIEDGIAPIGGAIMLIIFTFIFISIFIGLAVCLFKDFWGLN